MAAQWKQAALRTDPLHPSRNAGEEILTLGHQATGTPRIQKVKSILLCPSGVRLVFCLLCVPAASRLGVKNASSFVGRIPKTGCNSFAVREKEQAQAAPLWQSRRWFSANWFERVAEFDARQIPW